MNDVQKFDRYMILKALFKTADMYENDIAHNTSYTEERKIKKIQNNDEIFQCVVGRYLEEHHE